MDTVDTCVAIMTRASVGTIMISVLIIHAYLVHGQEEESNDVTSDIDSVLIKRTGDAHHGTGKLTINLIN